MAGDGEVDTALFHIILDGPKGRSGMTRRPRLGKRRRRDCAPFPLDPGCSLRCGRDDGGRGEGAGVASSQFSKPACGDWRPCLTGGLEQRPGRSDQPLHQAGCAAAKEGGK